MMYLDLGIMKIEHIIMQRRLIYLHYLMNLNPNSLLFRCLQAQIKDSLPGDWITQVENDFLLLNIQMTFDQIRSCEKGVYKKYIKEKVRKFAFNCLMEDKSKQQKCFSVKFEDLKMQEYLIESPLTTQQKQMLFQMRTLTYPVFANIPFLVKDTRCPCCLLQEDTMEHNLRCFVIQANTQIMRCRATNIAISDIFSSEVEKQAKLTVLFDQAIRRRKII